IAVALQYQVTGAGWTPAYNARLDPDTNAVSLEYFGVITQVTGEDWTDARLLLSTARPSQAGGLPTLEPWFLGGGGGGAAGLDAGGGHQGWRASASPDVVGVLATQPSGTVVLEIPGKRSVAGDGSPQRVPIGARDLPAVLELVTVPKL